MHFGVFHGVAHDNELDGCLVFLDNAVNSVNASKKAVVILVDASEVSLLDALESLEVGFGHGLDDEVLVCREEEETSTLALRFAGLKDALFVFLWVKALSKDLVIETILLA